MDDHCYCYLAKTLPTARRVATNPLNLMTRNSYTAPRKTDLAPSVCLYYVTDILSVILSVL